MKTKDIEREDGQVVKEVTVTCYEAIYVFFIFLLLFAFVIAVIVTVVQG